MKRLELYNNVHDSLIMGFNLTEIEVDTAFEVVEMFIEASNGFLTGSFLADLPNTTARENYENFKMAVTREAQAPAPEFWTETEQIIIPIGSGYFMKGVFGNDR